jgi:hypothetical protein
MRQLSIDTRVVQYAGAAAMAWPFVLWAGIRERPPWGDEAHFLDTVRQFGQGVSIDLLRSYNELSAPLTYIIFAAWGHLVGFDTSMLRLLSPMLASATTALFWLILVETQASIGWRAISFAAVVSNPYFVGLSVFVFTDMLSFLGLVIMWLGLLRHRAALVVAGLMIATLTRQYSAFLAAALVIAALASREPAERRVQAVALAVTGMIPLAMLALLWGGLAPLSPVRDRYLVEGLRFDVHALSLYMALPGLYLLPIMVIAGRQMRWHIAAAAGLIAGWIIVFPIRASGAQLRDGIETVGFAHRALVNSGGDTAATLVFYLCGAAGVAVVGIWFLAATRSWRNTPPTVTDLFPWAGLTSFLMLMPFSFQPWEKYAIPVLMFCAFLFAKDTTGRVDS